MDDPKKPLTVDFYWASLPAWYKDEVARRMENFQASELDKKNMQNLDLVQKVMYIKQKIMDEIETEFASHKGEIGEAADLKAWLEGFQIEGAHAQGQVIWPPKD